MSKDTSAAPSDEDVRQAIESKRAAELVLERHREARMAPLVALATSPEVAGLAALLDALDPALKADRSYGPHLHALSLGLEALGKIAATDAARG